MCCRSRLPGRRIRFPGIGIWLPPPRHAKLYEGTEIPYPATFDDDYATRKIAAAAEDMRFDLSLEPDYAKEIPKGLNAAAKKRWRKTT